MPEATISSPAQSSQFSITAIAVIAFFAVLWLGLWRQLSGEWSVNDQYSYGWFVPLFAIVLFWLRFEDANFTAGSRELLANWPSEAGDSGLVKAERWEDRPEEGRKGNLESRKQTVTIAVAIVALLLLFPIRLFEIGNPDWRPLDWVHAFCVVAITLVFFWWMGDARWLRHFAFPIAFTLVAVPWITPIEEPIVQGLMRAVAAIASETAAVFGIPTRVEGNLIRIPSGLLGINEACSGVRSLQTSLMIGLLFGELKRLSILNRTLLVLGAIGIAFVGNCIRAFALVWIAATQSVEAANRWHDIAGFAIVVLVFVGSMVVAQLLGRQKLESTKVKVENKAGFQLSNFYFALSATALVWLIAVEIAATQWYRAHERNLARAMRWEVQWPPNAPNFHEIKMDEDLKRGLRFDSGQAANWTLHAPESDAGGKPLSCTVYFFRWNSGKNSALLANSHRPDVCLPAIGWEQKADSGVKQYRVSDDLVLPFRDFEFVHGSTDRATQRTAHAFYCLWEDFVSRQTRTSEMPDMETSPSAWTRSERVEAVRQGRRHLGQQVLEVVLGAHGELNRQEAETKFRELIPQLVKMDEPQANR